MRSKSPISEGGAPGKCASFTSGQSVGKVETSLLELGRCALGVVQAGIVAWDLLT